MRAYLFRPIAKLLQVLLVRLKKSKGRQKNFRCNIPIRMDYGVNEARPISPITKERFTNKEKKI